MHGCLEGMANDSAVLGPARPGQGGGGFRRHRVRPMAYALQVIMSDLIHGLRYTMPLW
jgi:hypothetical protein